MTPEAAADGPRALLQRRARTGRLAAVPRPAPARAVTKAAWSVTEGDVHDHLLTRLTGYSAAAAVMVRLLVLPAATAVLASVYGARRLLSLVVVAAVLTAVDAVALRRGLRRQAVEWRLVRVSLLLSVAGNIAVAADVSTSLFPLATAVTGVHLAVTAALWTLVWGGGAGLAVTAANLPLQAGLLALNRAHEQAAVPHALALAVATTAAVGLAVGIAVATSAALGQGARIALTTGARAGREAERAELMRRLHDTVLQTLEAIALHPTGPGDAPEQTLCRLRRMARVQALQIRRALAEFEGGTTAPARLADDLATLADEVARDGLHVQLALGQVRDAALSPAGRCALRDAAGEALRNAVKHSGAQQATLHLGEADGGVTVVVRDHGSGFDEPVPASCFGIRQSIHARLAQAGGRADVWSQSGRGTRVTLWVPLAEQDACR